VNQVIALVGENFYEFASQMAWAHFLVNLNWPNEGNFSVCPFTKIFFGFEWNFMCR